MRLLIDTQIFIWSVIESNDISEQARDIILEATDVFVSAASILEIAIKARLGRLVGDPVGFVSAIEQSGFQELPHLTLHVSESKGEPPDAEAFFYKSRVGRGSKSMGRYE